MNGTKVINDPVFGFIKIPRGLLYDIVSHPLMQRLNRISQLGLTSVVYPGARHTRFQHSLGAFYLMSEAILSLQQKGQFIFDSEAEAVQAAILMHDIGHGPFSHVLENTLIQGISHEEISLLMMEQINQDFSFYTGVTEGNIGSARIIKMLNVVDDSLVVESKGIYSLENYLTTRRLMYWQVYLHKTTVAYEKVLLNMLKRVKFLTKEGRDIFASPALKYFLVNDVDAQWFSTHEEALRMYEELDDSDLWSAMKAWKHHDDKILATLATDMLNRKIFKVIVNEMPFTEEEITDTATQIAAEMGISTEEAKEYMMHVSNIGKDMYDVNDDSIAILYKDGSIKDISEASELLNVQLLSKKITKYYLCYQRI